MSAKRALWADTDPEAERRMLELYAAMTPGEKLQRVRELTMMVNRLALGRVAAEYPDETRGQHLLRLARIRLGDELVDRAYGTGESP